MYLLNPNGFLVRMKEEYLPLGHLSLQRVIVMHGIKSIAEIT
jgi:hypothetical protein